MCKFFGNKFKLKDITYHHLTKYYEYLKNERGNKNITIKHHTIIISPALKLAYRDNLIAKNPYEFMPRLKKEKSTQRYYDKNELEQLFQITDKTKIGLVVRIAAYYGFRRSEILGLKWNAVDFDKKRISIQHKVLSVDSKLYFSDTLKTGASNRALPLLPEIEKIVIRTQKRD